MKPIYSNVKLTTGAFNGGLNKIMIAPKDWVQDAIIPDFLTNKVIDEIYLIDNHEFLILEFVPDSIDFEEKPKSGKPGDIIDITISGTLNDLTPEILQSLETLRQYELVAILQDNNRRLKVVGDTESALILRFGNKENSSKGGTQIINIDLSMQSEFYSPFYEI